MAHHVRRTASKSYKVFVLLLIALLQARIVSADEVVISAENLPAAIAAAADGDTLYVNGGRYHGSLVIDKQLALIGQNWPVLDGDNSGTVLTIHGASSTISGFLIENSGDSLDQENTGLAIEATDVLIENNRFENTLFGIYLRHADGSTIRGNTISSKALDVQRRGDPIRIWYSNDVTVEQNDVRLGRDVVLWYSERLIIRHNRVEAGRYGLHFMYCDDALIEQNSLLNNSVGAFMMYSRRVTLRQNTIAGNRGPSGYAIGLKDMDDIIIEENLFLDNRIGAHLDTSPREVDSIGRFTNNVFAYNDIGVELQPSVRNNHFQGNSFVENEEQVSISGGGTPGKNLWTVDGVGNYWSDYVGYDADHNGQGDIEYKSLRLFENLMAQEPGLRLFLYSPAVNAIDFAARAFPFVQPKPKLIDSLPAMQPAIPSGAPPLQQASANGWYALTLTLLLLTATVAMLPRLRQRGYRFL
jgi:nitrous oxidase accessory protein